MEFHWLKYMKMNSCPCPRHEGKLGGGVAVSFPSFLSSSLEEGEWSTLSSSCFTLGKEAVLIEREAVQAPEPVWKFRRGISLVLVGVEPWIGQPVG